MFGGPVVAHVSQLVRNLAVREGRGAVDGGAEKWVKEDDEESVDDLEEDTTTTQSGDSTSQCSSSSSRKSRRVHRAGSSKTKKWRTIRRWTETSTSPLQPTSTTEFFLTRKRSNYDEKGSAGPQILGGTEPFGIFDLPRNSTTDRALYHWATVFQNTRMTMTPRQAWMKINLSDKTLASVTTYCSTYHFYFVRGIRAPPSCLSQKQLAIHNINNSLRKPNLVPNDYLMVAVAVMTLLECLAGDPKASLIHRQGLQLMVQTRGGIQNLGFDGGAQRTISWADTSAAIVLRMKPTLTPSLTNYVGESPTPGFHVGDLAERLAPLTTLPDINKIVLYIWLRLRYLSEFLAQKSSKDIDSSFYSDKLDFVERQCLSLLHSPSLASASAIGFLTAFLNACFIFIYEELRECPRWTNLAMACSERIYSGLAMLELEEIESRCPDLLMWVLVLGRNGVVPIGKPPSKAWYAGMIAKLGGKFHVWVPQRLTGMGYFELAEKVIKKKSGNIERISDASENAVI